MISDSEAEECETAGTCCARGCENSSEKGYTMKRFPEDQKLREIWLGNMGRDDDWEPDENSVLCHSHFIDPDQWTVTSNDRIILKEDAIPTSFNESEQNGKIEGAAENAYDEIEENLRKICDEGEEKSQDDSEDDSSKSSSKRKIAEETTLDSVKRARVEVNGSKDNQKQSKTNGTSQAGEKSDFWAKKLKDAIQESIKEVSRNFTA